MSQNKKFFVYLSVSLLLFNIFILPQFYKKIAKCYITFELTTDNQDLNFNFRNFENVKILSDTTKLSSSVDEKGIKLYLFRIIDTELISCRQTYYNIWSEVQELSETNDITLIKNNNVKSRSRYLFFSIINNILFFILYSAIYLFFSQKITLNLVIRNK